MLGYRKLGRSLGITCYAFLISFKEQNDHGILGVYLSKIHRLYSSKNMLNTSTYIKREGVVTAEASFKKKQLLVAYLSCFPYYAMRLKARTE